MALAGGAAADEVDGQIVAQAQEEGALIAQASQKGRVARQFDEQLLQHVARVRFAAQKVRKKRKHGGGVFIIKPCDVWRCGHLFHIRRSPRRSLSNPSQLFERIMIRPPEDRPLWHGGGVGRLP